MYKLSFFVPEEHADKVKHAVFETGAGRIGQYDQCCWETLGTGQFRPLAGSNPHLGEQGKVETVQELKVELVCEDQIIREAVTALKKVHPYETVAYDVFKLEDF